MQKYINHPLVVILLTLGAFVGAFFLDFLENLVGTVHMLYGAAYAAAMVLVSICVFALMSKLQVKQDYMLQVDILKGFIEANGLGQIINENEVQGIEKSSESVWVFTLDMSNDIGSTSKNKQENLIFEAVQGNLKQGKKYTYFVPDIPSIHGAIEEYRDKHLFTAEQVKFCIIPYEEFHFISELVIYDADSQSNTQALEWFPSKDLNYYFRLDDDYKRNLVGIAKRLIRRHGFLVY